MTAQEYLAFLRDDDKRRRPFEDFEVSGLADILPGLKAVGEIVGPEGPGAAMLSYKGKPGRQPGTYSLSSWGVRRVDAYKLGEDDWFVVLVDERRIYLCDQEAGVAELLRYEGIIKHSTRWR